MKSLNIFTLGCQMNVYDSQQIRRLLSPLGYENEADAENADIIIVNTCSIRQKAADKAFSFLGRIKSMKKGGVPVLIGVGGCVAQQEGVELLKRAPYIDFVFGTSAIHRLPEIVKRAENGEKIVDVGEFEELIEPGTDASLPDNDAVSGFVSIMRGCDNFCTYCIVPFVRGRETSRPPEDIITEIERRAANGMTEVTLLGQNVNSYGKKENMSGFAELLHMVAEIDNVSRIRFATSHPKDLDDALIQCFADIDKLCTHFHIPVQSGSNKVLKEMNRRYTREHYMERISALRSVCPGIELSTDIIVGFPGETDEDFADTVSMIQEIKYGSIFGFAYSDRPGTKASSYQNKIETKLKKERLNYLLEVQNGITRSKNMACEGKELTILVENCSVREKDGIKYTALSGRSFGNRIVHVNESFSKYIELKALMGKEVRVKVEKALGHSLQGAFLS